MTSQIRDGIARLELLGAGRVADRERCFFMKALPQDIGFDVLMQCGVTLEEYSHAYKRSLCPAAMRMVMGAR